MINNNNQIVYKEEIKFSENYTNIINVSYLASGIYYLKIYNNETEYLSKIIIE